MIGIVSAKLAKRSNVGTVYIYSTDRDFFQCIDGDRVFVMRPEGKGNERSIRTIKPSSVVKEFGVTPEQWAAYKALVGDPSDNYKGLPGCGPVSALTYLREGLDPSLPTFAEQSKHIKKQYPALRSHWQEIYSSYQLAYIPRIPDYPLFPKQAQKLAKEVVLESPRMLVRRMTREHMKTALALFTTFCADYELNSFIAERRNFFSTVEVIDESQEKEVQPQRHSACTKRMGLQRDNCPARSS
jgi:5'-3' exonuclease